MSNAAILNVKKLGFPWWTADPFLFCVHHDDAYPAGNDRLGPSASLEGRSIGQDFAGKDGWRMYHGDVVPGFPQHPHRGFETVTIVRRGLVDHSDSAGAIARYGQGDVQWLTAGRGIVHAEMFPLVERDRPNPLELFQIWLNLPRASKMAAPHFSMLWADTIPQHVETDGRGRRVEVSVVAGAVGSARAPAPPPDSWASRPEADVAIWTIRMEAGARWAVPAGIAGLSRTLYFFSGESMAVDGRGTESGTLVMVRSERSVVVENGARESELLLLQGRPLGEPVVQHGPFVMSTHAEIQQAYLDYQRTRFGGWPWSSDGPVHGEGKGRFARYPDGREERGG